MKLMVLDKKDGWKKHKEKVEEEAAELVEAIKEGNSADIAEKALDNLQVCIGILDKLYHEGVDIQQAVYRHNKKLINRGWNHKAVIKTQINKKMGQLTRW